MKKGTISPSPIQTCTVFLSNLMDFAFCLLPPLTDRIKLKIKQNRINHNNNKGGGPGAVRVDLRRAAVGAAGAAGSKDSDGEPPLMTVVPAGTLDPSAVMHHEAFAALAGMSALAATNNMAALWKGYAAPSPHPHPQSKRGGIEVARKRGKGARSTCVFIRDHFF